MGGSDRNFTKFVREEVIGSEFQYSVAGKQIQQMAARLKLRAFGSEIPELFGLGGSIVKLTAREPVPAAWDLLVPGGRGG